MPRRRPFQDSLKRTPDPARPIDRAPADDDRMRREGLVWVTRGAGLAVGVTIVGLALYVASRASGVLLLVFVALLLASALEPFIGWLRGHVPLGRGATILVVYALFLVLVVLVALVIMPVALRQLDELSKSLPAFLHRFRDWAERLRPAAIGSSLTALIDAATDVFTPPPSPEPGQVVSAGLAVIDAVVSIVTLLAV